MLTTLTLPALPDLNGRTALLEDWLAAEGETVRKGQVLLQISIDKAVLDIHAAHGGTLRKQYVRRGDRLAAGSPLGLIGPAHAVVPVELQHAPSFELPANGSKALPPAPVSLPREGPPPMSPRARRRAREMLVPLQAIEFPPGGRRIGEKEVLRAAQALAAIPASETVRKEAFARGIDLRAVAPAVVGPLMPEQLARQRPTPLRLPAERAPLSAQRRHILEQALTAHEAIPQTDCQIVIRCDPLLQFREELQKSFSRREVPSLNDLFIALFARVLADERFRMFRAVTDRSDIVVRGQADLAFTLALEDGGTIAPVLRAADRLTLRNLAAATRDLAHRAGQRKLRPHELQGGLATLCNLSNTAIASGREHVRLGQTAALLIPAPQLRPTVLPEGLVGFRTTWLMNLSTDRRLIDPPLAADFLGEIKRHAENPKALLGASVG